MSSDFTRVHSVLARERELGRPFSEAWELALEALPAIPGVSREALERRQAREVLKATRQTWHDGYEWRPSKMLALT
jgi:hypothetical protein